MTLLLALLAPALGGVLPQPNSPTPWFIQPNADGSYAATLRAAALDDAELEQLRQAGVVLRQRGGSQVRVGDIWAIDGSLEALRKARAQGFEIDMARRLDTAPPPIRETGELVQAFDLWAAGPTPAEGFTGKGIKILDIDSGIDLFHPHFFKADAGHFDWVDVDGNGQLDPGVDGVDLDDDGTIDGSEVLQLISAVAYQFDFEAYAWQYLYDTGELDPSRDWLFIDRNQDGSRNRGTIEGFSESDAAYGEPLFVPDDADRSGQIDLGERVLQLGTSVVAAVLTEEVTFERGTNLIEYAPTADITSHGSGVGGILVGGQLPHQRGTHGLAPDAELLIATSTYDDTRLAETLMWGENEGATVMLHEYAPWTGFALDGSSAVEEMVDDQQSRGITHVCPAGNLADAGKHAVSTVSGGEISFGFDVPATPAYGGLPWQYLWFELHADTGSPQASACELEAPSGTTYALGLDEYGVDVGDLIYLWSSNTTTSRGRPWATVTLWGNVPLEPGGWTLRCDANGNGNTWHAFLNDYYSGWGRGIVLDNEVRDNTMGVPSTSDDCISIGAYAGRWADEDVDQGELRYWSSLGPTVDGRRGIDLLAPDDPFSPVPSYAFRGYEALYAPFGGTSGASPHVTALAALLQEAEPTWTGLDVRDALMDAATPYPGDEAHVGAGKVQGYNGWSGAHPADAPDAVDVVLTTVGEWIDEDCRALLTAADDDGNPLGLRIDLDYDGAWDIEAGTAADMTDRLGADPVRVRAEASLDGWVVGGVATTWQEDSVDCGPLPTEPTEPTDPTGDDDDDGTPVASGDDDDDDGESEESKSGCGCQSSSSSPLWLGLGLLALVRRRGIPVP